jgi:hypothetical protein
MRVRASWMVVPIGTVLILLGGLSWWFLWPRPTLDEVPRQIATGQYRAAERKLREYLKTNPRDEQAPLLLARVLVERAEPNPDQALRLIADIRPADPHQAAPLKAIEGDAHFWNRRRRTLGAPRCDRQVPGEGARPL